MYNIKTPLRKVTQSYHVDCGRWRTRSCGKCSKLKNSVTLRRARGCGAEVRKRCLPPHARAVSGERRATGDAGDIAGAGPKQQ